MLQPALNTAMESDVRRTLQEVGLPAPIEIRVQEDDYGPYSVAEVTLPTMQVQIDHDRGVYCLAVRADASGTWINLDRALRALGATESGRGDMDLARVLADLAGVIGRLAPRLRDPTFARLASGHVLPERDGG